MEVFPAIDLRNGQVVRLAQGDYDHQTTYSSDPLAVAGQLVAAGARWIHMVDLDAARSGQSANLDVVEAIRGNLDVRIQLGGGARSEAAVERMLAAGADRVVVGSAALENWAWFERLIQRADLLGRIALGLDARDGRVAIKGWTETTEQTAVELAGRVRGRPVAAIIYTDIARDGMLLGPNIPATAELVEAADVPVIASGGVSSLDDLARCKAIGCAGVVVGRAYYEGKIDLRQALELADK